jgi:hypothetical protein
MSMAHVRVLLATVTLVAALGIPAIVFADTTISGKVATSDGLTTLPSGSVLVIQLFETPKGGVEGLVRGPQQISVSGSGVPVSFNFSAPTPNPTSTYRLVLMIGNGTTRRADYQGSFAVLNNNQLPAVFTLPKMPGTLPILSGGSQPLLLGLLLAGLAVIVTMWRWQRRRVWQLQRA